MGLAKKALALAAAKKGIDMFRRRGTSTASRPPAAAGTTRRTRTAR
jgi:hypothetical protein